MILINRSKIAAFGCLFLALLGVLLHVLKLTKISYEVGAWFFYLSFPLSLILLVFAWHQIPVKAFRSLFLLVIGLAIVHGNLVSLMYSGSGFDFVDWSADNIRFLFVFLILAIFWGRDIEPFVDFKFIKRFVGLCLLVVFLALLFMFFQDYRGASVYFGLQSTLAITGLAYGLIYKKSWYAVISLALIFLSGKRGVLVSAMLVILFYLVFVNLGRGSKFYKFLFIVLISIFIYFAFYFSIIPDSLYSRFVYVFFGDVNWHVATAGRNVEVLSVFELFSESPSAIFSGFGLGANMTNAAGLSDSTIHISPLAMVFKVGLLFTFFLYLLIFLVLLTFLFKAGNSIGLRSRESRPYFFWLLVFLGEFGYSMTTFTLLQSFVLWFSLSIVLSYVDRSLPIKMDVSRPNTFS